MTYEEYRRELNEALEKADWMNPRDKNGLAYRVLARAARDKALPLAQWQKLHDEYEVGVQRLRKVNLRRDAINEEMLEVMAQPRKSGREQAAAGQAWLVSLLPEGAETEFRVPLGKGAARKQKELQIRMAVDNAATLERRVYAAACAEVLGFGAKRLNDLHKAVLENFRQLSA